MLIFKRLHTGRFIALLFDDAVDKNRPQQYEADGDDQPENRQFQLRRLLPFRESVGQRGASGFRNLLRDVLSGRADCA